MGYLKEQTPCWQSQGQAAICQPAWVQVALSPCTCRVTSSCLQGLDDQDYACICLTDDLHCSPVQSRSSAPHWAPRHLWHQRCVGSRASPLSHSLRSAGRWVCASSCSYMAGVSAQLRESSLWQQAATAAAWRLSLLLLQLDAPDYTC